MSKKLSEARVPDVAELRRAACISGFDDWSGFFIPERQLHDLILLISMTSFPTKFAFSVPITLPMSSREKNGAAGGYQSSMFFGQAAFRIWAKNWPEEAVLVSSPQRHCWRKNWYWSFMWPTCEGRERASQSERDLSNRRCSRRLPYVGRISD